MGLPVDLSRRQFIVRTAVVAGGLSLGFGTASAEVGHRADDVLELNPWITIAPDDTVTVQVATGEIGNGAMTQFCMTVTEELGCAWSKVRAEFASVNRNYLEKDVYLEGQGPVGYFTGGSTMAAKMRPLLQAGASARERLKLAAAQRWNVPAAQISVKDGVLTHAPSGRTLRFGEVAAEAATVTLAAEPALKPESEWTFLGKATPSKLNNRDIVTGKSIFGLDVRQPGMLYAALKQAPEQGARLKSYDFEAIRKMPGVHSVVVVDPAEPRHSPPVAWPLPPYANEAQPAVAVVADHYWQARTALEALPIEWEAPASSAWKTTAQYEAAARKACEAPGEVMKHKGDVDAALAKAATVVRADYLTPFCEHAPIEPLNGTALVTADRVDLWHPTQHAKQAMGVAMEETGLSPEQIFVHPTFTGGAFGRRVLGDDSRMVLAVAKKVPGRPVHVIWSREEATRHGRYRAMGATRMTAALDASGMLTALHSRSSVLGYPGGPQSMFLYLAGVPNLQIERTIIQAPQRTGPYRGPGYNFHAFFVESFIDECAAAAHIDPVAYRLKLLESWPDKGWTKCLNEVAKQSGWGKPLPKGQGRGVAINNWRMEGKAPREGTTVACVAHVEVSKAGVLKIHQIDVAFDCGRTLNADAVQAMFEGGSIFGLNMSLHEGLAIKDGVIQQSNFHDYTVVRMAEIPPIRIHRGGLSGDDRISGAGEAPAGPIGPAIANAIFAATGKRIRRTPILAEDLSWA